MANQFVLGKAPFIRRADSNKVNTKKIMKNVAFALIPLILFAWYKNGISLYLENRILVFTMLYPIVFIAVGGISAFLFESLYFLIVLKEEKCFKKSFDDYSIIPGLMLAMILPLNTPIWVLLFGVFFGVIVGKMLFGGFGYNIFNPALLGYIFIMAAFYDVIVNNGAYLNFQENIDIVSGATPLSDFKSVLYDKTSINQVIENHGGLLQMFIGNTSGSLAETSVLLCLLSYLFLSFKKSINYKVPIIYVLTCFLYSLIIGIFIKADSVFNFALFNILNGGIMFAAVFMVTEPVTSPRNINGKYLYSFFIAILSISLRFLGDFPEGVSTAILFMNMLSPIIDTHMSKLCVSESNIKKIIFTSIVFFVFILITLYTIFKLLEVK